jgi:hypothetical protein
MRCRTSWQCVKGCGGRSILREFVWSCSIHAKTDYLDHTLFIKEDVDVAQFPLKTHKPAKVAIDEQTR